MNMNTLSGALREVLPETDVIDITPMSKRILSSRLEHTVVTPSMDSVEIGLERRSLSREEIERKNSDSDERKSPESSFSENHGNHLEWDDMSYNSTYSHQSTYSQSTTASSESVHSIIERLHSETDRRRRRLMRRRAARGMSARKNSLPSLSEKDPLKGITVEVRE